MKQNLSPEEQDRIEADFLRAEADRRAADHLNRKRRKERIKSDISFEAVRGLSTFAAGFFLVASFYSRMLGPALMMAALWIVAVSICILRMRPIVQQTMAEPGEARCAEKPPGDERSPLAASVPFTVCRIITK